MAPNKETKRITEPTDKQLAFMLELSTTSITDQMHGTWLIVEYFTGYSILVDSIQKLGKRKPNPNEGSFTCEDVLKDIVEQGEEWMPTIVNETGGYSFGYIGRNMKPSVLKNFGIVIVDVDNDGTSPERPITLGHIMDGILDGRTREELSSIEYWLKQEGK